MGTVVTDRCRRCRRRFTFTTPEEDVPFTQFCPACLPRKGMLTITTTPKVIERLEALLKSGLYGLTIEETADRVLTRGLEVLSFRRRPR